MNKLHQALPVPWPTAGAGEGHYITIHPDKPDQPEPGRRFSQQPHSRIPHPWVHLHPHPRGRQTQQPRGNLRAGTRTRSSSWWAGPSLWWSWITFISQASPVTSLIDNMDYFTDGYLSYNCLITVFSLILQWSLQNDPPNLPKQVGYLSCSSIMKLFDGRRMA